jgi:hypothetical protein
MDLTTTARPATADSAATRRLGGFAANQGNLDRITAQCRTLPVFRGWFQIR